MIRRNFLTNADSAERYIDGVRRLKDPGSVSLARPGRLVDL